MRTLVNSVTYWDVVCLNKIFGLDGKKLVSIAVPWISHSGNGYYYPALPLVMFFFDPEVALQFLLAALAAFALELPLYKLLKNCIKRDRPCEALTTVQRRTVPSDRFSFPSGHTAAAIVMATLVSCFIPILTLPVFAWALLVGFSRIFLGVHYPTDILAGIVIGLLCGWCGLTIAG
jgi:undecaprenyl-diphosphatase